MKAHGWVMLIYLFLVAAQSHAQRLEKVIFYNVENLFDTIDASTHMDEAFTPGAAKKWNTAKYEEKLEHLAWAIKSAAGEECPAIVGLCEVENRTVLSDLVSQPLLTCSKYSILHRDSPDERGIDVGLLYNPATFELVDSAWLQVALPDKGDKTREILYASLKEKNGHELHVFINHWPSRWGGQKESEGKRVAAAKALSAAVDKILKQDAKAQILIMGDFNDTPSDKSISKTLGAAAKTNAKEGLVNLFTYVKPGTHAYNGSWSNLDQMIVSTGLLSPTGGIKVVENSAGAFHHEQLLYYSKKFGQKFPSRSYGKDFYYGGYSDHLPIKIELVIE